MKNFEIALICGIIREGKTTKELAELLNVSGSSVEKQNLSPYQSPLE